MSGPCGIPHRIPILRGWTSGFSVEVVLVLSAPLRCHSSRKCMWSKQIRGRHLSLPKTNLGAPPPSPPPMVGYMGIPSVERSVVLQLCPTAATTLRGDPCLLSQACLYSSCLTGSVYRACGEATSASTPWRYCRSTRPKP